MPHPSWYARIGEVAEKHTTNSSVDTKKATENEIGFDYIEANNVRFVFAFVETTIQHDLVANKSKNLFLLLLWSQIFA